MAIEGNFSIFGDSPDIRQVQDFVAAFLRRIIVTVVVITWLVFWSLVARLHVETGDFISAGVVGALFVFPVLGGLVYLLRESLTRN